MSSKSDQELCDEICDTIHIAKFLIDKCDTTTDKPYKRFTQLSIYAKYIALKMYDYTGVDAARLEELAMKVIAKKSLNEWLKCKDNRYEYSPSVFECIRNIIIDQYVNKLQIPTKSSILKAIQSDKNNYLYSSPLLQIDLNNLGFIWRRLPKMNKYIIVEDTKQVSNRMKYFHQMKEYRKSDRVLIYVERAVPFPLLRHQNAEVVVIASPQLGFIETTFPPKLRTLDYTMNLHAIPQNSVFVIEQSNKSAVDFERTCEVPTMYSKKTTMIEWLKSYDIPFSSTMHRSELFTLIEKHKAHCPPVYKICEILKAAGHDVILRPPDLAYTGYFKRILKPIFENNNQSWPLFKTRVVTAMNEIPPDTWFSEDLRMAAEEHKIYEEDLKLELLLENLMDGAKNKRFDVADFEECDNDELDTKFLNKILFDTVPVEVKKKPSSGFML